MKLILVSIVCGILSMLPILAFGLDGSYVNFSFAMAIGLIGFLCPGLYVLDKLYKKSKKEDSEKEKNEKIL